MEEKSKINNHGSKRWRIVGFLFVLFDIFALNFSYYAAILVRFYVNFELDKRVIGFVPSFFKFAPYYTVISICIFGCFKLYNSMWKYAGINDLNRILIANGLTCLVQVFGTLLFVRRMPISYYCLGAIIQLFMIVISRFSIRLLVFERNRLLRRNANSVNALIVGAGETARIAIKQLESGGNTIAKPVCIIDSRNSEVGRILEGVPVVGGIESIKKAVQKYKIEYIVIADLLLADDIRNKIIEICKEMDISWQNFSGYLRSENGSYLVNGILEHIVGEVLITIGGETRRYENYEQAMNDLSDKYIVKSIKAVEDVVSIELVKDAMVPNDIKTDWAQDYVKETGEEISFF